MDTVTAKARVAKATLELSIMMTLSAAKTSSYKHGGWGGVTADLSSRLKDMRVMQKGSKGVSTRVGAHTACMVEKGRWIMARVREE